MSNKVNLKDPSKNQVEGYVEAYLIGKLVDARNVNGLTQEQLANIVGMKQSAVARLETLGSRPRIDTMLKLLRPLGYTLDVVPLKDTVPELPSMEEKFDEVKKQLEKVAERKKKETKKKPLSSREKRIRRQQQNDFAMDWD